MVLILIGNYCKLIYPTVDNFISIVRKKGIGLLMFKRDVSRAYPQFPFDLGDIHLHGFFWSNKYFLEEQVFYRLCP